MPTVLQFRHVPELLLHWTYKEKSQAETSHTGVLSSSESYAYKIIVQTF